MFGVFFPDEGKAEEIDSLDVCFWITTGGGVQMYVHCGALHMYRTVAWNHLLFVQYVLEWT